MSRDWESNPACGIMSPTCTVHYPACADQIDQEIYYTPDIKIKQNYKKLNTYSPFGLALNGKLLNQN